MHLYIQHTQSNMPVVLRPSASTDKHHTFTQGGYKKEHFIYSTVCWLEHTPAVSYKIDNTKDFLNAYPEEIKTQNHS